MSRESISQRSSRRVKETLAQATTPAEMARWLDRADIDALPEDVLLQLATTKGLMLPATIRQAVDARLNALAARSTRNEKRKASELDALWLDLGAGD